MSDAAARALGAVFRAMTARGEERARAQRFTLQCVAAMFAEDAGLLPRGAFTALVADCRRGRRSSELLGGLFRKLGSRFDGGLFATVDPVDLAPLELALLGQAAGEGGEPLDAGIFGALFLATVDARARHERGAHYTPEAAILAHVVGPSLVEPWRARIRAAASPEELLALRGALGRIRVLDPACGSGNFLHVAHRALQRLELELLARFPERYAAGAPLVHLGQLFGIDRDPFAVELAKVTLVLGAIPSPGQALPSLDANVVCDDALFCAWPSADVILGNPPFQAKNKMRRELGADYVRRLRLRYPEVPGRADYCVYWFRRAHEELAPGARAGLVGTNTIRQNYSREGGLDPILAGDGTITEAVSTMVWPGEAVVHVSVVNWIRGEQEGPKKLSWQEGDTRDGLWREVTLDRIPSSLSARCDVTRAQPLLANAESGACYQGQTHGHKGFLLTAEEARAMCSGSRANAEVIFPYLIGEELLTEPGGKPTRWVIDFRRRELPEARRYRLPFQRVEELVRRDREVAAASEQERNASLGGSKKGNRHHENFLRRWWLLSYARHELITRLEGLARCIVCSRVTKRPIFELVSTAIRPGDALMVFPLEDDYSFGVLQSGVHGAWFKARCSTLKGDWRYTSNTVFDSFPWPQAPAKKQIEAVAKAAVALRTVRRDLAGRHEMSLRAMYASMDEPGKHPLKDAQATLDAAVRAAYGMGARQDPLAFLLAQNAVCAAREAAGEPVVGPGLPPGVAAKGLVTNDAVQPPKL